MFVPLPRFRDLAGRILARVPAVARLQAELAQVRADLDAERAAHRQTRVAVAHRVAHFARDVSDALTPAQERNQ